MKKYGLNELREMYLSFFESKNHLRLPSFSLVPQNDKSILLINAGMTPMKPWFKGEEEPPRHRVCTCQKCIRTGDIDNVGKTARHGTYFEMLGNFSFGDYFKKEALEWSWEFLTEVVGLEPDRLYPSIYVDDDEAFEIWNKDIGIAADRIFRFGKEDNFWEHGSGPCGPCSEIYYDRGVEYGCGKPDCKVGCDCDRFMEIWNNVFSQFDNDGHGNYSELKQKNIDTGMGLERLAVVCQGVNSLFEVDTVMNITNKVSELTGAYYGQSEKRDISLRVITDHIRSSVFMICDGVLPSNEGRGYVLRRLLRRAARHGKLLGVNDPFLYDVVDTVVHENECEYPELREKQVYITKVIRTEEENFGRTIDGGMKIFSELLAAHKEQGEKVFSGADAFRLYDTYGFPIDLTIEMAGDEGLTVDEEGFKTLMQEQKTRAREARKALGDLGWAGVDLGKEIPATEFLGYDQETAEGKVLAIVAEGENRDEIAEGIEAILVLDKTVFYAEMGGQVADHGTVKGANGLFEVTDVQKNKGGKYLHYGKVLQGTFSLNDVCVSAYDIGRRNAIRRAHSATHLLQSALEKVLGDHVHQAGSYVEPDRLRFDFTHFSAVTPEEMKKISEYLEQFVLDGVNVETLVLPIEEAKKLGATALFGEKYGDTVRVVKMGDVSLEFCGGTHLNNSAKVGPFKILSEASVASGVRRIEMLTGKLAREQYEQNLQLLEKTAAVLKSVSTADTALKAQQLVDEMKEDKRTIEQYKQKETSMNAASLLAAADTFGSFKVVTALLKENDPAALRLYGDIIRERDPYAIAALVVKQGEKLTAQISCGKNAIAAGIRAGDLMKGFAPIIGGKGGGKPDGAMGGGTNADKLPEAFEYVKSVVASK